MAKGIGNQYPKGMGKLCCKFCAKPYRDHRLGPCPEAPEGALSHRPTAKKERMAWAR